MFCGLYFHIESFIRSLPQQLFPSVEFTVDNETKIVLLYDLYYLSLYIL